MKIRKIVCAVLSAVGLAACFEDEGNYSYKYLDPPTWLINTMDNPISVWCRLGEDALFKGSDKLTWGEDSMRRNTVRYEWILKNVKGEEVVIGEGLDLAVPTEEMLDKLGYKDIPSRSLWGHFAVVDQETGVRWLAQIFVNVASAYDAWDWFVLSENGTKAKLSAIRRKKVDENGQETVKWVLQDNVYEKINGHEIPGKPLDLVFSRAKNIGTQGAATVITEKAVYEINNETMTKEGELKDQFLDGAPVPFDMVARRDIDPIGEGQPPFTFVATRDGKVYTRTMSKSWLGGEFLSEPYYIDAQGYSITSFGHSRYGSMFPCYDELNRRVVMACTFQDNVGSMENPVYAKKMKMVPLTRTESGQGIPVWGFPEGTKVLHLSENKHFPQGAGGYQNLTYSIVVEYKGNYMMGDFVVNAQYFRLQDNPYAWYRFFYLTTAGINSDSKFLLSANARGIKANERDLFSVGQRVYYLKRNLLEIIDKSPETEELAVEVRSRITFMTYDWEDCNLLLIGCEDGSLYGYDVTDIERPVLAFELNVGGKVVSAKQLGYSSMTQSHDYY